MTKADRRAGRWSRSLRAIAFALLAVMVAATPTWAQDDPEDEIRSALAKWTRDFNGGDAKVACEIFHRDLVYDFRGHPTRGREEMCEGLETAIADESKRYAYALDIKDIQVSGDLAVVRLDWTLTITLPDGQSVVSQEPGMDVFRRQADGSWKIVRFIGYDVEQPAARQ